MQAVACALLLAGSATVAAEALPGAGVVGQGRLDWLGLRIYEARLLAPAGFDGSDYARHPFMLELTYHRALRGRDIARRSIEEMRRAPGFPPERASGWERELAALLPDVRPGDRIAGVHRPGAGMHFVVNGRAAGHIGDARFAELFFGIWLAPHTSEPTLRAALLGLPR